MDKGRKLKMILIGFLFLIISPKDGLSEGSPDFKRVVSVNPLGLVLGVGNVSYEWVIKPDFSGVGNLSFSFAKSGGWNWSAFGGGGGVKKYLKPEAPQGLWYGGEGGLLIYSAEYLGIRSSSTFISLGGLVGYKWIVKEGFTIEPQGGLYLSLGSLEILGEGMPLGAISPGIGLNIGYAF